MRTEHIVLVAFLLVLLAMTACAPAHNGIVIERVASYQVPLDVMPAAGPAFPLPQHKPVVIASRR